MARLFTVLILVAVATGSAFGGITPHEVVVVYNSNSSYPASKAVADYYCAARGIPLNNQVGVNWPAPPFGPTNSPHPSEWGTPTDWISVADFVQYIQNPLEQFLIQHFGADPDDSASDPIKAIVLCYGIPVRITDSVRQCSVDSALTMLFEHAPWGRAALELRQGEQMLASRPKMCYNLSVLHSWQSSISPTGGYAS